MNVLRLIPLAFIWGGAAQAQQLTLPSSSSRAAIIEASDKLLALAPIDYGRDVHNPFSMKGFEVSVVAKPEEPAPTQTNNASNETELLAILADKINPRGRFVMNGEVMLLTPKQKLKVGSKVPVTHEGLIYELEIAAIDINRFTVRYKTEEFTRPITSPTPAKKP